MNSEYYTNYYYQASQQSQINSNKMDYLNYRGFTCSEILNLAAEKGQGEAMSQNGATGLFAAIEWIDNFYDKHKNTKLVGNKMVVFPKKPLDWYAWEKTYSSIVDRSSPGKQEVKKDEKSSNP